MPPSQPQPRPQTSQQSSRPHYFALGLAGYLASFLSMIWFAAFLANLPVPGAIDGGPAPAGPAAGKAVAIDLALIAAFGFVHSLLARKSVKERLARHVPPALERSLYSLVAGLQIAALCWGWQALPRPVWEIPAAWPTLRAAVWLLQGAGWAIVIFALATIGSRHLFGLHQASAAARGLSYVPPPFEIRGPYRFVRHPVYTGSLLAFWAAPTMSEGRLLLVAGLTIYLFIGLAFEERALEREFGDAYLAHRRAVPSLIPRLLK